MIATDIPASGRSASALKSLAPMGWVESLLLFGIPAAVLAASIWILRPYLVSTGMTTPMAYMISLGLVNLGLVAASLVGYAREGNPLTWAAFSRRMRLTRMSGRVWLWAIGGTLVFGVSALLIEAAAVKIYAALNFVLPAMGIGKLALWMNVVTLSLNIIGEELWWRGFILPRQEQAWGKHTWWIHGILWACFHMFKWYAVPFMLITCQVIPFVAQRTKSTWPGMLNHLIINSVGIIIATLNG